MINKNEILIKGNQIQLKILRIDDVSQAYVEWLNDPEINQFLETSEQTLESVRSFVDAQYKSKESYLFGIFDKETHIGNIKIGPINKHNTASIGLLIGDKSYWGKGIASEAIGLCARFAFTELNLDKVHAGCYENNMGSYKAFTKNGFVEEGRLRKQIDFNGERIDSYVLGLLKSELNS